MCAGVDIEALAAELHRSGLARTEKARRTWRDTFASAEEYNAYMRSIALKGQKTRIAKAVARRRAKALAAAEAAGLLDHVRG